MSSWEEFRAAAPNWAVPAQNLVYADVEGNIGYQTPGSDPGPPGYSGKYPVPGWDSTYGWDGFIEFDALPNMLNPESGLVITANNAAIGEQYPYLLTDDWDYGYRAQRITDLLAQATAGRPTIDAAGLSPSSWTPTTRTRRPGAPDAGQRRPVWTSRLQRRSRCSKAGTSTTTQTPRPRLLQRVLAQPAGPAVQRRARPGRPFQRRRPVVVRDRRAVGPARRSVVGRHDDSGAGVPGRDRRRRRSLRRPTS